ncbi:type III pantothenate kinase [Eudoraea chungangensis]|uniref:type III pantothenate kinase n=1 Tax=Eudoraea chungangensis TaxID=1481905 RepID=UPI0023EB9953|nr:type III pantothenate kinase [Eudoraea chungangensis]
MNLVIDAGNTLIKYAVFNGITLLWQEAGQEESFTEKVKGIFHAYPNIRSALVSSVIDFDKKKLAALAVFCEVHLLSHKSRFPLKISYATPNSLGMDRLALATAAFYKYPESNVLVIDAGSCVTYDIVNDFGEYLGGAISPGLHMRYKALHRQTQKLPLLNPEELFDFIGNSTASSIHSGILNGISLEIDGVIALYQERFKDLTVILTGGDAQFLSKRLKNTLFANSNFLLEGLNYLLEYNKR